MKYPNINLIYVLAAFTLLYLIPTLRNKIQNADAFYGIAENPIRDYTRPNAVVIQTIQVKLGDQIKKGDTLMVFHPKNLVYKKEDIASSSRTLQLESEAVRFSILQELEKNKKERSLIIESYRIKKQKLADQKRTIDSISKVFFGSSSHANDKYLSELKALEDLEQVELKEKDDRRQLFNNELSSTPDPKIEKRAGLKSEEKRITEQEKELFLIADGEGIVGQLDFVPGDPVESYQSLIKIYASHPNLVTTYIGEGFLARARLGDEVKIYSINNPNYLLKGKITSLGTRITALPERLKKIPEIKAWGREVQIEIPLPNELLQGEKVSVNLISAGNNKKGFTFNAVN